MVLNRLEPLLAVELGRHTGGHGNRAIPLAIGLERRERQLGCLRSPAPTGPVDRKRDGLPALRSSLDDGSNRHPCEFIRPWPWAYRGRGSQAGSLPKKPRRRSWTGASSGTETGGPNML